MKEFKYVITDAQGIHARPASELVKELKGVTSVVKLTKEGKTVGKEINGCYESWY